MSEAPRIANVSDLQHTPVTLGVVLAVQAVAVGAVLLVAGVLWGRIASLEHKIDGVQQTVEVRAERLQREVGQVREDMREIKVLHGTLRDEQKMQGERGARIEALLQEMVQRR